MNQPLDGKNGPRPEAGAFVWTDLTQEQRDAINRASALVKDIVALAHRPRDDDDESVDDAPRYNNVLLFNGQRGSGKSTALLSFRHHLRKGLKGEGAPARPGGSCVIAPRPIDLDQLAPGRSVLVQLAAALYEEASQGRRGRTESEQHAALSWDESGCANGVQEAWLRFVRAAVHGREAQLGARSGHIEPAQFAMELEQAEREGLRIQDSFRAFLNELEKEKRKRGGGNKQAPVLFLICIDDADLAFERTYEMLHLTRLLHDPRLIFALAGDKEMFQVALRQHFMWSHMPAHLVATGRVAGGERALSDVQVNRLAADALRKLIPEAQSYELQLSPTTLKELWEREMSGHVLLPEPFADAAPATVRELWDLIQLARYSPDSSEAIASALLRWVCQRDGLLDEEIRVLEKGAARVVPSRTSWMLNKHAVLRKASIHGAQAVVTRGSREQRYSSAVTAALLWRAYAELAPAAVLPYHIPNLVSVRAAVAVREGGDAEDGWLPWPEPAEPGGRLRLWVRLSLWWKSEMTELELVSHYVAAVLRVDEVPADLEALGEIWRQHSEEIGALKLWLLSAPEYGLSNGLANHLFQFSGLTEEDASMVQGERRLRLTALSSSPMPRSVPRTISAVVPRPPTTPEMARLRAIDERASDYQLVQTMRPNPSGELAHRLQTDFVDALKGCRVTRQVRIAGYRDDLADYLVGKHRARLLSSLSPPHVKRLVDVIRSYTAANLDALMLVELWHANRSMRGDAAAADAWVVRSGKNGLELNSAAPSVSPRPYRFSGGVTIQVDADANLTFKPVTLRDLRVLLDPASELILRMARDIIADNSKADDKELAPLNWRGAILGPTEKRDWWVPRWLAPLDMELQVEAWNVSVGSLAKMKRVPGEAYPLQVEAVAYSWLANTLQIARGRELLKPHLGDRFRAWEQFEDRLRAWVHWTGESDAPRTRSVNLWIRNGIPEMLRALPNGSDQLEEYLKLTRVLFGEI